MHMVNLFQNLNLFWAIIVELFLNKGSRFLFPQGFVVIYVNSKASYYTKYQFS